MDDSGTVTHFYARLGRRVARLLQGCQLMEMSELLPRCCCAAAGKLLLLHGNDPHSSHVPACSAGARSTKFDMLPLTVCALCAHYRTVMTGASAAEFAASILH